MIAVVRQVGGLESDATRGRFRIPADRPDAGPSS